MLPAEQISARMPRLKVFDALYNLIACSQQKAVVYC